MRYTFVQQQDATDCAAACLAMVCLLHVLCFLDTMQISMAMFMSIF